jgi:hypothetical protein
MAKAKGSSKANNGAETVSGYFRRVFKENPRLLKTRSNDELLNAWLADHPGEKEVPQRVKQNLANVKSVLRKKGHKRGRRPKEEQPQAVAMAHAPAKKPSRGLEHLEEQIDDCLTVAKQMGREGLEHVIRLLRQARNAVVWKLGE